MRNLKLLDSFRVIQEDVRNVTCITVDCDTGCIYYATDKQLVGFDPREGPVSSFVSLMDEDYLPADGSGRVIGIHYLSDQQAVCAATSTGNLLLWNVSFAHLECVGSVDSGITNMSWSPDLELLVLTTGANTFVMMTSEFDPVTESSLQPDQFGEAEFVQVGWGKKETQFHGSEGKVAATKKVEVLNPVSSWDDRTPRISWRGDGQFFAISFVHTETGIRKVLVWTRECVHHSSSENVDGIEQSLSWRPTGSLIVTSQRRPNRHDIAFFENNGLRHGEFTLPFKPDQVKVVEVMWNLESSVLAVWCEDLSTQEGNTYKKTYIILYTTGNYHWYLKQSLQFDIRPDSKVVNMIWDPEQAYRMHIMCSDGQYLQYTWSWVTSCSYGVSSDDQALTAVIDGDQLLMTPMRNMLVPPPMCAYRLQLPSPVNQVVFAPPPHSNNLAVVLSDNRLAVYKFSDGKDIDSTVKPDTAGGNGFNHHCSFPTLSGIYSIQGLPQSTDYPISCSHFTWLPGDIIILTTVNQSQNLHSVLHEAEFDGSNLVIRSSSPVEGCVYSISCDSPTGDVAIQLTDGSILKYSTDSKLLLPWEAKDGRDLQFPLPCSTMCVCEVGGETVVLGLTERYRFYVNDVEVASNCTSFSVHDEFLLLTTLSHTCRCISRHIQVKVLPTLSDGKAHPFDESIRRVERGSRIVTCVADDTKLVLQMPRGNLETVHPRALILSAVRKQLDKLQFGKAFVIMRKHRINMNLLIDHQPSQFLDNVELFVRQVEAVSHINLFLTDLLQDDVTVTMYTAAYVPQPGDTSRQQQRLDDKIDTICDAVRRALYNIDENKYLLSILTSYVRKSKPDLQAALELVKNLRATETSTPHVSAEEALKYLLFLVDVNELYDIALGTYDFDLVLMVAEKSQKDPKEYIPFLNQLRKLDESYQKYTIDKHLKRFEKALENIVQCGADHFNECLTLIQEHKLYLEGMRLYTPTSTQYKDIANAYGDYLADKKRHREAAIMYSKAENWEPALKEYEAGNHWQHVFCVSSRLQYTAEQEAEIGRRMAARLRMHNRQSEAAILLEQYVKDFEEAIVTLIEGSHWDEALRLMYKYKRTDFIETDLRSAMIDSHDNIMSSLETMEADFEKYRARLVIVRQEKERARLELLEGDGALNNADRDLFSDTSSATGESIQSSKYSAESGHSSIYSKMSGRSTRNRRKAEQKRWKLKEGSQYEDFALISVLAKTVKHADGLREEIQMLLRVLVEFHYDLEADSLQRRYDTLLTLMEKALPEIWTEESEDPQFRPVLGPDSTANAIAQAMQRGQRVQGEDEEKLDPIIRFPPVLRKDFKWKLYCIEPNKT